MGTQKSAPPLASEILARMISRPSRSSPELCSYSQPPLAGEILRGANERFWSTRIARLHVAAEAKRRRARYAGEAKFNNGKLSWWGDVSDHYHPDRADALQAGLPTDGFHASDQVLRGMHKRKGPRLLAKTSSS